MNNQDNIISEEIRSYLGLKTNNKQDPDQRLSLGSQHMLNHIETLFRLKANKLSHFDSVVTAFSKTHQNMYIDDPAFATSFKKELTARATPKEEIEKALDLVDIVLDKVNKEFGVQQEKDAGNNPNWDDVVEVSQPEQPENGELLKPRDGHKQKENIKSDLPIGRKSTSKRGPVVLESIDIIAEQQLTEMRIKPARTPNLYPIDLEIQIDQEFIEASIMVDYDAEPAEPMTHDYPGQEGQIIINDFEIKSMRVYSHNDQDGYKEISPSQSELVYRNAINKELQDPRYEEEIATHLNEEEESYLDRSIDQLDETNSI